MPPRIDLKKILEVLANSEVAFIVVGGVCAALHGVPVTTFDLDIVHERTPRNITRLLAALDELEAVSRLDSRGLKPNESHLAGVGHVLLTTRLGPLDVLGSIGDAREYEALLPHTETIRLDNLTYRILDLRTLIASKREAGRPKDLAHIPLIQAALQVKNEQTTK